MVPLPPNHDSGVFSLARSQVTSPGGKELHFPTNILDIRGTRVGFAESTTHPTAESKRFKKISFLE